MRYAENTSVPVERSKAEIEKVLTAYGATGFMYGTSERKAMILFKANNRLVRFSLPFPDPADEQFRRTETGRTRKSNKIPEAYDQEVRRRWRALSLAIKAKLEAVATGITLFDEEFLAHIVLPDGKTVAEDAIPKIDGMYKSGKNVPLLPFLEG